MHADACGTHASASAWRLDAFLETAGHTEDTASLHDPFNAIEPKMNASASLVPAAFASIL